VAADGLTFSVAPRAAVALGLILHELTTNAVKYGSLSNDSGKVSVAAVERLSDDAPFVIEWRESGGPSVAEPSRRGFGRTVISRSLQYSPNGSAELIFAPEGVRCRIMIPDEDVVH
jgi:two-component sensor histidine kinase